LSLFLDRLTEKEVKLLQCLRERPLAYTSLKNRAEGLNFPNTLAKFRSLGLIETRHRKTRFGQRIRWRQEGGRWTQYDISIRGLEVLDAYDKKSQANPQTPQSLCSTQGSTIT
jgi:hypothetical protein